MSEVERKACCIAAIIHDLGKMNDREGAEHGYNSMLLYEEKIKSIIDNVQLQSRTLNAIRYHSVEDKDCPEEVKQDVIWKVLKDADALDRSRFAGKGCDKSYLRLGIYQSTIGQSIIDLTSYLPGWTHDIEWNQPYIEMIDEISKYSDLDNDN
jgi:HD superfamily phosphohydrolase YqeK